MTTLQAEQPTLDADLFPEPGISQRYIGRCKVAGCKARPHAAVVPIPTACPNGHGAIEWAKVTGRHSAGRHCDARCEYAKGTDCECQCAGRNHGRGWS